MIEVVYFSKTGNTRRFVEKLGLPNYEVSDLPPTTSRLILVTPTYSNADGSDAVPPEWDGFLRNPDLSSRVIGVVACGDRAFGSTFGKGGALIAARLGVPVVCYTELVGTETDRDTIQRFVQQWK